MTADEPTPGKPIEIRVHDSAELNLHDDVVGIHGTGVDSEGLLVRESDWEANAQSEQGTIVQATSKGRPPQGEEGSLSCAQRYVNYRRSLGEDWWDDPIRVDESDRPWLDCEAFDRRDLKGERLLMQVQGAMVGNERYKEWAREKKTGLPPGTTIEQTVALVLEATSHKPPADNVVLLLDAVRLPWLALREVVTEVRRHYAVLAEKTGFRAIYVVPWAQSAIRRLDQSE
jgi:hypothetical protein